MTTHTNNSNNSNEQEAEKSLQLSARLNEAINNLRVLPDFRAMARDKGEDTATMAITTLLRETRPELFDPENPGDGLAFLYAGMD